MAETAPSGRPATRTGVTVTRRPGRPPKQVSDEEDPKAAFAVSLRKLRTAAGMTQEHLATRAGYSRGYIAQLERSEKLPPEPVAEKLGLVLEEHHGEPDAAARLQGAWARAQAARAGSVGPAAAPGRTGGQSDLPPVTDGWIAYQEELRATHGRGDSRCGGAVALPLVQEQARLLLRLTDYTEASWHRETLRLGSLYFETCSWLLQDTGRLSPARTWADRALAVAYEAGDAGHRSHALVRKSAIASDAGQAAVAVRLAEDALACGPLSAPQRASALRQLAVAHALQGDYEATASSLTQAMCEIERHRTDRSAGRASSDTIAPYAVSPFVLSEGGRCWLQLGDAERAEQWLTQSYKSFPVQQERRDFALCLLRLSRACAGIPGKAGQAVKHAKEAASVVKELSSARVVWEAQELLQVLRQQGLAEAADGVDSAVRLAIDRHGLEGRVVTSAA